MRGADGILRVEYLLWLGEGLDERGTSCKWVGLW